MEKKLLIQDIAEAIATKSGINKKDSETFVKALFETIEQGLTTDKFVKIKGFGTFKVIAVGERESININTGERFSISGHDKITFTPETSLKELVNRPFSHFQTVVLNEETEIEELENVDALSEDPPLKESNTTEENIQEDTSTNNNVENTTDENIDSATLDKKPSDLEISDTTANEVKIPVEEDVFIENAANEQEEIAVSTTNTLPELIPNEKTDENQQGKAKTNKEAPTIALATDELPIDSSENPISSKLEDAEEMSTNSHLNTTDCEPETHDKNTASKFAISSESQNSEQNSNQEETNNINEEDIRPKEVKKGRCLWKKVTIACILIIVLLLTYFAGYFKVFCPCEFWNEEQPYENIPLIAPISEDSIYEGMEDDSLANDTATTDIDSIKLSTDSTYTKKGTIDTPSSYSTQSLQSSNKKNISKEENLQNEFDSKLKQVDGGKYQITGTLRTHKIKKGETIRTIAQEVYGSKGYATYIITHNELGNPNLIDTGTVIKLPKLKRK